MRKKTPANSIDTYRVPRKGFTGVDACVSPDCAGLIFSILEGRTEDISSMHVTQPVPGGWYAFDFKAANYLVAVVVVAAKATSQRPAAQNRPAQKRAA